LLIFQEMELLQLKEVNDQEHKLMKPIELHENVQNNYQLKLNQKVEINRQDIQIYDNTVLLY
jgi:hypothetical protein